MAINTEYAKTEPRRSEVDALRGPAVLEFGSLYCGYCRAAQPLLVRALEAHPQVRHLKVEDASGRRLGRSFGVKLWPTFVFLADGREVARLVRPIKAAAFDEALGRIDPGVARHASE
jgi:thioredoxin 1